MKEKYSTDTSISVDNGSGTLELDANVEIVGSLTAPTISGPTTSDDDISCVNLNVSGDATVTGAQTVGSTLTVSSSTTSTNYMYSSNKTILVNVPLYNVWADIHASKTSGLATATYVESGVFPGVSVINLGSTGTWTAYLDITPYVPNNSSLKSVSLYTLNTLSTVDYEVSITAQTASGLLYTYSDQATDIQTLGSSASFVTGDTFSLITGNLPTNLNVVRLKIEQIAGVIEAIELFRIRLNLDVSSVQRGLGVE